MATAAGTREAARSAADSGAVALGRETAIARAAIAVIGLHYADVAFLQPQPGTSPRDHLVSGLVPIVLLAGFAAFYPRMRAGLRASAALALGVFALGSGLVTSGWHTMDSGPSGVDYTGLLAAVGGGVLIGVGGLGRRPRRSRASRA